MLNIIVETGIPAHPLMTQAPSPDNAGECRLANPIGTFGLEIKQFSAYLPALKRQCIRLHKGLVDMRRQGILENTGGNRLGSTFYNVAHPSFGCTLCRRHDGFAQVL